ncbi:BrnA antitoxin family protein [Undibacterium sp.]|uniref:BrnA antitoxin family protein n=1 Tax=Undibacterium sp. TaxID=1914977 RepID=UPI0025F421C0|nr:BrnA antitoxin family protein [Undibacterium sp.]
MTEAEIADQVERLVAMPDSDIDTTDIPEAPAENWALAKRPGLYRPIKKPVTLRLDTDVVTWFKDHAQSGGYQTEINRVLRRYVQTRASHG